MNIVFWILVMVAAILFWLVLSPVFWTIGDILLELWNRAKEEMKETEENKEEK